MARRITFALVLSLLALVGYYAWPIYGFLSHDGDAPLPFWGWVDMPATDVPSAERCEPEWTGACKAALAALEAHRKQIGAPSMSAAVAVAGEVVWAGATGWADLALEIPAEVDTQYRIGSTSKSVTATLLARLVDRGVINLDAPLTEYFDELPNPDWATITPRMLASHMAGIPHYGDVKSPDKYGYAIMRRHYDRMTDALGIFAGSPLLFEPGTKFEYSSLGTVLLAATMEQATGETYAELVAREVLEPAGATATIVAPKRAPKESDLATFYLARGEGYREWRPVDLSHRLAGGGWASTPSDLARIGSLWLRDGYVDPATRKAFWTPQRLSTGEVNEQDYAIGFRWREWDEVGVADADNANHGGVSRGSQSWFMILPEYDAVLAVNVNRRTDVFWDFGSVWASVFRPFAQAARDGEAGDAASAME